jgi:hypothetical protein
VPGQEVVGDPRVQVSRYQAWREVFSFVVPRERGDRFPYLRLDTGTPRIATNWEHFSNHHASEKPVLLITRQRNLPCQSVEPYSWGYQPHIREIIRARVLNMTSGYSVEGQ